MEEAVPLAELLRSETMVRKWVLKAWRRTAEARRSLETIKTLEARLDARPSRSSAGALSGDADESTAGLRRQCYDYAKALASAAEERDAAEARCDALRDRSGRDAEVNGLRRQLKAAREEIDALRAIAEDRASAADGALDSARAEIRRLKLAAAQRDDSGSGLADQASALEAERDALRRELEAERERSRRTALDRGRVASAESDLRAKADEARLRVLDADARERANESSVAALERRLAAMAAHRDDLAERAARSGEGFTSG